VTLPDPALLRRALEAYTEVVERQGAPRLPELDAWYRDELPRVISGRSPRYLTLPELERLTEWKMARGVWRARNLVLVRGNDPEDVVETSRSALSLIPHPTAPISGLAKLAGVGPATASADDPARPPPPPRPTSIPSSTNWWLPCFPDSARSPGRSATTGATRKHCGTPPAGSAATGVPRCWSVPSGRTLAGKRRRHHERLAGAGSAPAPDVHGCQA
jgi:hypothetical protein